MDILIIDDDKEYLDLLSKMLNGKGFEVYKAFGGMAALEILAETEIDVIISDVVMFSTPIMSLTCTLKNMYPNIPIILISGFPNNPLIENSLMLGADKFLPKPVNMQVLLKTINSVVPVLK